MEFWGAKELYRPTYSEALRHFVRYKTDSVTIAELRRLASDQAALERKWFAGREALHEARAPRAKVEDYEQRIHFQAERFATRLGEKLAALGLPLFAPGAGTPEDRTKFMAFLSDLLEQSPRTENQA